MPKDVTVESFELDHTIVKAPVGKTRSYGNCQSYQI